MEWFESFAYPVENGSQTANRRFFDSPEITNMGTDLKSVPIFEKILSRGEAIFQRFGYMFNDPKSED
jgi:hypothetical protein